MRHSEKNVNLRGSGKYKHSNAQSELKPCSSLRFKTCSPKSQVKKHKLKPKSHSHRVGANTSRKAVTDSSKEDPSKEFSSKNLIIRKGLHKTDGNPSQKPGSSKPQSEKASLGSKKEGKDVDGEVNIQKLKRRRRKKKSQRNSVDPDDASRLQRRLRYLLIKIKREQNLIDAYSGEGWKGQSQEKIKPEKELLRARKQILHCKLSIRDAIHQLDTLSSVGSIEGSVIAPDGSVYHEHIFCAKCKLREAFPDNDIILCDGTCNRAFHQKCLDPPLDTENIPPGDQGWFCEFCECKMEILEAINAHLGTHFSLDSTWQDVFKEEASTPDGDTSLLNPEEEWPSDDSDDDDYNPERREDSHNFSAEDIDGDAPDDSGSSTSLWNSDDGCSPGTGKESIDHEFFCVNSCMDSDESGEIACGRRQRKAVDYKKLYDEMFGKDAPALEQVSEDEDWGPGRRKRREKESDVANTLMTLHESDNRCSNNVQNVMKEFSSDMQCKRPCFRLPRHAVEKLRQAFSENELPPRSVKEGLSKELGLDADKVSKWFKNARYLALKARKQAEGVEQPQSTASRNPKDSSLQHLEIENLTSKETSKVTVTDTQMNVANDSHKRHLKSSRGNPLKKRKQVISPLQPKQNGNKDLVEFSDDVSLKKLLEAKKRKVTYNFEGDSEAAELEFGRLSKLKNRVENMKQKIIKIRSHTKQPQSKEPSVIYVPVAELKEKS
ncbi:pathogenesis-related homeodomain protein [Prosopis cineraria]|uniref:pathogenesis-related homeodomain protein n=1 Tax=Prosopis cineraria TaxID=364024 RepID=UPI00240FED17|nr:pathogenesis-related homeodomain protein [Prosopis cineraria]XP_054822648.1 pathogenesis-related homeodomain protein [Prosopis cineraria]XP_054822649.1 pathogenesis-related homeodomain protein [Prosopis cineraria]